jgi:hypothetical protein
MTHGARPSPEQLATSHDDALMEGLLDHYRLLMIEVRAAERQVNDQRGRPLFERSGIAELRLATLKARQAETERTMEIYGVAPEGSRQ